MERAKTANFVTVDKPVLNFVRYLMDCMEEGRRLDQYLALQRDVVAVMSDEIIRGSKRSDVTKTVAAKRTWRKVCMLCKASDRLEPSYETVAFLCGAYYDAMVILLECELDGDDL